jgi:hypothetical protein
VVGVAAGEVEVVQHEDDRLAGPAVEVGEEVEQLDLVVEVEERRGLVEEQHVGVLGKRHGDPDALRHGHRSSRCPLPTSSLWPPRP